MNKILLGIIAILLIVIYSIKNNNQLQNQKIDILISNSNENKNIKCESFFKKQYSDGYFIIKKATFEESLIKTSFNDDSLKENKYGAVFSCIAFIQDDVNSYCECEKGSEKDIETHFTGNRVFFK